MATAGAHAASTNTILRPIESNTRWTAGPVTYNIVTLDNAAELTRFNNMLPQGNQPMNMDLQPVWATEFALAFLVIEEVIPLDLQLNNDIEADFLIGQDNSTSLGYSSLPGNTGPGQNLVQGYNLTDASATTNAETGGGSDRFHTVIHEMGHSLGLAHPHDPDDGSTSTGVADSEMQPAPYQQHQTVMSYTSPPNVPDPGAAGAHQFGYAVSLMALDIAVLHAMYGANMTTRTGNSTYTLTDAGTTALDNTGETISVGRAYYSIWDAGTNDTDTIQYTGASRVIINLNAATLSNTPPADVAGVTAEIQASAAFGTLSAEAQAEITNNTATAGGFFSSILDAGGTRIQGGFTIANGVVIENATGGSGNDILAGNAANNLLIANAGDDLLIGGNGNDQLSTGLGSDTASGGAGDDTYLLTASVAGNRDTFTGGAGTDTADFSGFGSAVWVDFDAANSQVWTQDDQNVVDPAGTWRRVADLASTENVVGTNGVDDLRGSAGNNVFGYRGTAANAGIEQINGRGGTDTADFSAFGSAIWADLAFGGSEAWTKDLNTLSGGVWREIANLTAVENITGTNGIDDLRGDGGNNVLGYRGTAAITGVEQMDGRGGTDTADFSGFGSAVWIDLAFAGNEAWTRDQTNLTAGTYREIANLTAVENITGTNGIDDLRGDGGNNVLGYRGTAAITGVEQMDGRGGTDTADFSGFGSAVWIDLAFAGNEAWTRDQTNLTAGTYREIANLTAVENITGTNGIDDLRGDGSNNVFGYRGTAEITGVEQMDGRGGTDTADFSGFGSAVWVDLAFAGNEAWTRDQANLAAGTYREIANLTAIESLEGTDFADSLRGDGQANTLIGGLGNDELIGRGNNDTFIFEDSFGADVITDFDANNAEKINLSMVTAITSFADLTGNHLRTDAGSGFAEIFDGTNAIRLNGYTTASVGTGMAISEDDFIF